MAANMISASAQKINMHVSTYVAHVDDRALLAGRGSKVGKGVRRNRANSSRRRRTTGIESSTATKGRRATVATAESTAKATATSKASAATETTTTATEATAEAATATETWTTACESVLAYFQGTALPLIAIELGDGVASIVRRLKCNNTGSLGTSSGVGVHIGTDNSTVLGYNTRGLSQFAKRSHKR